MEPPIKDPREVDTIEISSLQGTRFKVPNVYLIVLIREIPLQLYNHLGTCQSETVRSSLIRQV